MRTAVALRAALTAAGVVVAVTGCGSDVSGTATTPTADADPELYNPCTELEDGPLIETGVDPATKDTVTDAAGPSSWRICSWDAVALPYYLIVASSSHTVEETRNNPDETGFRDVPIGQRTGLVHQDKSDTKQRVCRVGIPATQGMFVISASWKGSADITHDRCELAIEHATELEPYLPR